MQIKYRCITHNLINWWNKINIDIRVLLNELNCRCFGGKGIEFLFSFASLFKPKIKGKSISIGNYIAIGNVDLLLED
jgi:hypothetical protein